MKRIAKFLTADESSLIPLNESLRIGLHDKPGNTAEEIYDIIEENLSTSSDTIFMSDEFIDVENIIESMYEYRFNCVGCPTTKDAEKVMNTYINEGFSTQFNYNEYTKSVASTELYNLKLREETSIRNIFASLDTQKIDTKDNFIKLEVYEDKDTLLCGFVQYVKDEEPDINELLLVIK